MFGFKHAQKKKTNQLKQVIQFKPHLQFASCQGFVVGRIGDSVA